MLADLVVWDRNLLTTPPEELLAASPDMTVVDGRIVFERKGQQETEVG
jgi:predicted amidohydrolase YtcJ